MTVYRHQDSSKGNNKGQKVGRAPVPGNPHPFLWNGWNNPPTHQPMKLPGPRELTTPIFGGLLSSEMAHTLSLNTSTSYPLLCLLWTPSALRQKELELQQVLRPGECNFILLFICLFIYLFGAAYGVPDSGIRSKLQLWPGDQTCVPVLQRCCWSHCATGRTPRCVILMKRQWVQEFPSWLSG